MNVLLIDGNSIINRAFYGIKNLANKQGVFTNALVGFMNIFMRLLSETQPDAVAIAFDLKDKTFRHEQFKEYKAGRHAMPPELASQLQILKELLPLLGYKTVEAKGFEADDIIGTLADACLEERDSCFIATGDRDSLQLVNEHVTVLLSTTKEVIKYTPEKIKEDYGVSPSQLIEIKGLMGDSSDNIPGVAGIGKKTATDLIVKYHDIDNIYGNLDNLDLKTTVSEKLRNGKELAYLSRRLGTICVDVPIEKEISEYKRQSSDNKKAKELLVSLEMFQILKKLDLSFSDCVSKDEKLRIISEAAYDSQSLIDNLKNESKAFFVAEFKAKDKFERAVFAFEDEYFILEDERAFGSILSEKNIEKICEDSKAIYRYSIKNGIPIESITFDSSVAGYILNPSSSSYETEKLYKEYSGSSNLKFPTDDNVVERSIFLRKMYGKIFGEIETNNQKALLEDMEIPLSKVLADMELIGFSIDENGIKKFGERLSREILQIEEKIYGFVGHKLNLNSPKQLGVVLFEELNIPPKKKTKLGYSTNAEVLEELSGEHEIISDILRFRTISKLKSTYCEGLIKSIKDDGKIHSTLNQKETRTGRISSLEPNLQNIPVRQKLGREMRKFFLADEGSVLIDADYSQIELRVLAHLSDDEKMKSAFLENKDIHTITASQVFSLPISMVTSVMRNRAKAVNFGIVYGIGAFSLAKDIGVTRKEAESYIRSYFDTYSGIESYMKKTVEDGRENGYVKTLFERRRYLPELRSSNKMISAFGERVARNMPIQGTAADIIKIAMIRVYERLIEENMKSKIIMQIHDELIVQSPKEEVAAASEILKYEMENAVKLSVPILVDVGIGRSWYDAKN